MDKCCLETHPEFNGCCCKCRYRLHALSHYRNTGVPIPDGTWACIAFAFMEGEDIAYIGDFEHGICELFTPLPWPLAEPTIRLPFDEAAMIIEAALP